MIGVWLANRLGWIDLSDKSSSGGGGALGGGMGAIDEVFHPSAYEVQLEKDRQVSVPAPAPIAGDDEFGIFQGATPKTVQIHLDEFGRPVSRRQG